MLSNLKDFTVIFLFLWLIMFKKNAHHKNCFNPYSFLHQTNMDLHETTQHTYYFSKAITPIMFDSSQDDCLPQDTIKVTLNMMNTQS